MQNRIERQKKAIEEEKQLAEQERRRNEKEAAQTRELEEEKREEKRQAIINTPEFQTLLKFAHSKEVEKGLKEIWDYQYANKPIELKTPGFFGTKKKRIKQIPFDIFIESNAEQNIVKFGFEFLRAERVDNVREKAVMDRFTLSVRNANGSVEIIYYVYVMDWDAPGYEPLYFKSLEEFLNYYARSKIT